MHNKMCENFTKSVKTSMILLVFLSEDCNFKGTEKHKNVLKTEIFQAIVQSVFKMWILSFSNTLSKAGHFAAHGDYTFSALKETKHPYFNATFLEHLNRTNLHHLKLFLKYSGG